MSPTSTSGVMQTKSCGRIHFQRRNLLLSQHIKTARYVGDYSRCRCISNWAFLSDFKITKFFSLIPLSLFLQITQMKIDHNPYARAFRESIPSDDGYTPERKGGHFVRCAELTHSTSPSRRSVARRLCRETSLTSPPFPSWETSDSDERATSVESGKQCRSIGNTMLSLCNSLVPRAYH